MQETVPPKVFISYSWDDEDHRAWVKDFATRLREDGVDVNLDRWAVTPGDLLPEYMERSVRENDFVLIICTPQYKSKSDDRRSGVGYEGDIMTAEVFLHGNDKKFIPILRKGKWEKAAPSWLMGKYYLDLRGEPYSEKCYQDLLDNLFHKREKAPPLGKPKSQVSPIKDIVIGYARDDKDFTLWLALQLVSQGYSVFCDLLNPEPGEYTQTMVEDFIKNKAAKYLFVLSKASNAEPEHLKELRYAYEIAQKEKLIGFVLPVQIACIADNERNILLQGTSPVDFSNGWSKGLDELLRYLEKSSVPKDEAYTPSKAKDLWRLQFNAEKGLKLETEELLSNWFPIKLPENILIHELDFGSPVILQVQTDYLPFPAIQHSRYLVTFAKADDFSNQLGGKTSIKSTTEIRLQDFLDGNYDKNQVDENSSWNLVTELINDAWNRYLAQTKLKKHILANGHASYYFPIGFSEVSDNKAFFQSMDGRRSWRFLAGKHKNNFWHFGIQGRAMLHPTPIMLIKTHGWASSNGTDVWQSADKLHTARRRWFKNWWNGEWRDRLLAAMSYLSNEKDLFEIKVGTGIALSISSTPLIFLSPTTYSDSRDIAPIPDAEDQELLEDDDAEGEDADDDFEDDDL
jgi:hypothetical protein